MNKMKTFEQRKSCILAILERMQFAYRCDKQQLIMVLDSNESIVNNWIYFGHIPFHVIEQCSLKTGKNLEWLMFGTIDHLGVLQEVEMTILKGIIRNGMNSVDEQKKLRVRCF